MKILAGFVAVAALVLVGCPSDSPPVVPPPPDATDGAVGPTPNVDRACVNACFNLAALGCSEGNAPGCAAAMTRVQADRTIVTTSCPTPGAHGCALSCAYCGTAKTAADAVTMCASSCSP